MARVCWPRTKLTCPSPKLPFLGTGWYNMAGRTHLLTGRTGGEWAGRGCCTKEALGRPQDASVPHACVPGKCWREVLMERALLWVCLILMHVASTPVISGRVRLLQNNGFHASDFTCQMTRSFFISPMRCVPASCQDEWNNPKCHQRSASGPCAHKPFI